MRKTKIVATLGPASESREKLEQLADAGMNVARQNMSHGTHDEHRQILNDVHSLGDNVAAMMDTQGPEIRLRDVEDGTVLKQGATVHISAQEKPGDEDELTVDHPAMFDNLETGDTLLIDDGEIELEVEEIDDRATCSVIFGGPVSSRKSVNVPGKDMGLTTPTEKDVEDIRFGAEEGFDLLAISFVKSAEDIHRIQDLLDEHDSDMDIIAKIEHIKAVENLDEIIEAADGLMVARGDLGVEISASDVPLLQKKIIKRCNRAGKPVIVATQMLKSMTKSPRATRAEVSDIANAVLDGTDAVMLSEETAVGDYPVKSVSFMSEVVAKIETSLEEDVHHTVKSQSKNIADIICKNVWQASRETQVEYIVAHTSSGYTARNIAKYRPNTDIIAFTDSAAVKRKLSLVWGVDAYHADFPEPVDEMICQSAERLYQDGLVGTDDTLVLSAGVPTSVSGTTNMLEIRTVKGLLDEKETIEKRI